MGIERNGYLMTWCTRRKRYIYNHRLVVEKSIGRDLLSSEIVHHENGDKHDNRLTNLTLTNRADHARDHIAAGTWGIGKPGPRYDLRAPLHPCPICGQMFKRKQNQRGTTRTCSVHCGQKLRWTKEINV